MPCKALLHLPIIGPFECLGASGLWPGCHTTKWASFGFNQSEATWSSGVENVHLVSQSVSHSFHISDLGQLPYTWILAYTLWNIIPFLRTANHDFFYQLPVVPRKAVAEVSKIGHYRRGELL